MNVHVLTYATDARGYFRALTANPLVTVLGYGTRWHGFHDKVAGVLAYARETGLPPDALVCFVDGFDSVVLTRDVAELREKFTSFDADIVFSRERTDPSRLVGYLTRRIFGLCGRGVSMNSGMWMADVRTAERFWSLMRPGEDDQVFASRICREPPAGLRVAVDAGNVLFYNYTSADYEDSPAAVAVRVSASSSLRRILVSRRDEEGHRETTMPCVISAPGSADMNGLLRDAGVVHDPALLPDKSSYPYAYHAGIFFRQWAFRELLPETLTVLFLAAVLAVLAVFFFLRPPLGPPRGLPSSRPPRGLPSSRPPRGLASARGRKTASRT